MPIKVIAFVGASNSGKTTLICELIPQLRERFGSIGVLKHTHHAGPSRHGDTDRFLEAGACVTILAADRSAWRYDADGSRPGPFDASNPLRALTDDAALWVVEGFKERSDWPRILVHRSGEPIVDPAAVEAVISDQDVAGARERFASADHTSIVDFIDRITTQ